MTIAINMKVNDGLVLATDSASTIFAQNDSGKLGVINVYNNANKLFNLHKKLPIGLITWGAGSIGLSSISTLVKDFRKIISDDDTKRIDVNNYKIEDICTLFVEYIYKDKYIPVYQDWKQKPDVGFVIAGYSSNEQMAEEWIININNGVCKGPTLIRTKEQTGLSWNGQPEAITRLYFGINPNISRLLEESKLVDNKNIPGLVDYLKQNCILPLTNAVMPIQDAIELAEFLVDLTEKYSKYAPGPQTVGGPIEIAAITKHEGFKWIKRKHYYEKDKNI